jgi:hypothetical protein
MTAPPIKDTTGRPAVELAGATADSSLFGIGAGLCLVGAEFGSGTDTATVIAGEYAELARVPFPISCERWEILAYDNTGAALAIDAVVDVQTSSYPTNAFASIAGSDLPTLSGASKNESVLLTGWTLLNPTDTMYRFVLVSFTGSPAKIVVGIRGFAT